MIDRHPNPLQGFDALAVAHRVLHRCDQIAGHSDLPDRVCRLYLTDAALAVNALVGSWMSAAEMSVRFDQAGNVVGRRAAACGEKLPKTLLLGSHLDTVPGAGRYDGVLGVMVALAAAEALGSTQLPFHVDVIGFSEEEGVRFKQPYLGSAAVAGRFDLAWLGREDSQGLTLRDAIVRCNLDPEAIAGEACNPAEVIGFAEVHLEQGPVLEHKGLPVGVVTAIQGQSRLAVRFIGRADHAGTVPMECRRDAMVAAARLVVDVNTYGRSIESLRATVGQLNATPNVRNVIPGQVDMSLDIRHSDDAVRERAVEHLLEVALRIADEQSVGFDVMDHQRQPAVQADGTMSSALVSAVRAVGVDVCEMPSGAGHDAVVMAQLCPMAMLFVRHPGGVSHHPDESVLPGDVGLAIEVLTRFILELAKQF